MTALRTISDDTPILPDVVARRVVEDVERFTGCVPARHTVYIQQLVTRAEALYLHNPSFRQKIRSQAAGGNAGRDYLYTFMRHWYAGLLLDHEPIIVHWLRQAGVWDSLCNGQELPATPLGAVDA